MEKPLKIKICSQFFFAPHIFPPKHFCFPVFFSSPEWLFTRKKFSKNFAGKISSPKESAPPKHAPQNFLPRKFLSKKICSPFCSPNFHPKEFAPQIFPPKNLLPNIFALHITSHKKLLPKFCSPKIFAAQTTLWSSYGTWLIQVQWQGIVRCLQRFYWIFVICLKIVIEQKKHLDLQYVQGIPLQQLPGS